MFGGHWVLLYDRQAPPHLCSVIFGRIAVEIGKAQSDPTPSASTRPLGAGSPSMGRAASRSQPQRRNERVATDSRHLEIQSKVYNTG